MAAKNPRRVVVVGGGFGGTIVARTLRTLDPRLEVVLVERHRQHVACPFSNLVIAGLRPLAALTFGYDRLAAAHGIRMVYGEATAIDAERRRLIVDGQAIAYDRLVLSPGIDFRFEEIDGYAAGTADLMPHAWQAGAQTLRLRQQLRDLPDGGTVVISVPLTPYRCPPAPYERAGLIAGFLKQAKPRAKLILLDANPEPAAAGLPFQKAWQRYAPGIIEYRPAMRVTAVDEQRRAVLVEGLEEVRGDVINLIPPQRAGAIAAAAGLLGADRHWCPVDPVTFASTLVPNIHVVGDACQGDAMPKSGDAANAAAKACAANIVALLNGSAPLPLSASGSCFSFLNATEALGVTGAFKVSDGRIVALPDAGGIAPGDFSRTREDALRAERWLRSILAEMSGAHP